MLPIEINRYFVCVALLLSHREALFKHSAVTLPETLTRILIQSPDELKRLFRAARTLKAHTPATFIDLLRQVRRTLETLRRARSCCCHGWAGLL